MKMEILNVTNGDSTAETLRRTGLGGEVLPWRDILHEGPVPADLDSASLAEVRARYLAAEGQVELDAVRRSFAERDALIERAGDFERVILWFEHDLYDQLQLLQIFDRLSSLDLENTALEIVMIDDHPAVERFVGLGQLSPEQLRDLADKRRPVTPRQLEMARVVWEVFRSPTPGTLYYYSRDNPLLPFLGAALRRHLEQFPSLENGLGRTEQQALEALASGPRTAADLFATQGEQEEAPFLGDTVFWAYLERLAGGAAPLLTIDTSQPFGESRVTMTPVGERVFRGEADCVELNGIDRWYGGVHLEEDGEMWRRGNDGSLRRQ